MSRAIARAAVAAWFQPPAVTGLNTVLTAQPKEIGETAAFTGTLPGTPSGALAWVHIEGDQERRRSFGGPGSGQKKLTFDAALVLRFMSYQPLMETAVDDNDQLIENIKTRLRSSRTLNNQVWQAGEGDLQGAPDIFVLGDLPFLVDQATHIWSVIRFKVCLFVIT